MTSVDEITEELAIQYAVVRREFIRATEDQLVERMLDRLDERQQLELAAQAQQLGADADQRALAGTQHLGGAQLAHRLGAHLDAVCGGEDDVQRLVHCVAPLPMRRCKFRTESIAHM